MTEVSQLLQIVTVHGADATTLLQGQFTADVIKLQPQIESYCAYCDLKGKIGWLFKITKINDTCYHLTMPYELVPSFLLELKRYAMFSQVEINILHESFVQNLPNIIDLHHPMVYLSTQFKYFPHDLRLEQINAVSFTKGCFRGQEIIARMQHKGTIKRQTYIIQHPDLYVSSGEPIFNMQGIEVGSIVRTNKEISLAVITLSYLQDDLLIQDQQIIIEK